MLRKTLFIILVTCITSNFFAQGCSDAGFCTMGALRPDQPYEPGANLKLRSLQFTQYLGITRFDDFIHVSSLEFNLSLPKKIDFQIKLPYQYINGPLGTNHSLSDISLGFTKPIVKKEDYALLASLGTKIPTNNSDASIGEAQLPMYYQTSLGTIDFIAGISFKTKKWLVATGYQQQVIDFNDNNFSWAPWAERGLLEIAQRYVPSKNLKRGRDVMFRVERNFNYSKFNFYVGLLDVWRLNPDKTTSPQTGEVIKIENEEGTSRGHAITLLSGFGYNLNTKSSVKLMFGQRLWKRKFNPDGLSREQVFTLGYLYKF